ncbi:glutathione S-transferase family protein [Ruegeria arenilitoris]|uniref:glutathione S-transferase family protein n=1 Tax=Ruegeria arenilitoris TaxID=1173585 RepID=UPI00147B91E0|nr:glutathione S-transferase family protein [Ruegeria arenilitoris]
MYKIYGRIQSRASRVIWLLEELGQDYEWIDAGPHDPRVLDLNGTGKIPVLHDGDAVISDSAAIMTYLADKHRAFTYPAGTPERAEQDSLLHALLEEFDAPLWLAARHMFILPKDKRVPQVVETAQWEFDRSFQHMGQRFKGPFLQGEQMTIADILCVHCMSWAKSAGFPMNSDSLKAYGKRVRERPAYKKLGEMAKSA